MRINMREMGSIPLLNRAGEVSISAPYRSWHQSSRKRTCTICTRHGSVTCRQIRIAQMPFSLIGCFWPISLPFFHGMWRALVACVDFSMTGSSGGKGPAAALLPISALYHVEGRKAPLGTNDSFDFQDSCRSAIAGMEQFRRQRWPMNERQPPSRFSEIGNNAILYMLGNRCTPSPRSAAWPAAPGRCAGNRSGFAGQVVGNRSKIKPGLPD